MKKILFTGFEPFGGDTVNPSWDAVLLLPEKVGNALVKKRRMPVEYDRAGELLQEAIEEEQPDAVLCVGLAARRAVLTPEMVAINLKDSAAADNAGVSYAGEAICEDGPAAYFATVPVKAIAEGIRAAGVPAAVSYSAGTYVCNSTMYHLLYLIEKKYPKLCGGFIHVPCECSQVLGKTNVPSLPVELIEKGLEAAAQVTAACLENGFSDLSAAAGYFC